MRAYLDHNATTPLRPAARAAMVAALDCVGNASSVHAEGRAARAEIELARDALASLVGTSPKNIVFTSGATEALNLALTPELELGPDRAPFDRLLIAGGEHSCVLSGHRFPQEHVDILPLTAEGVLDLEALRAALEKHAGHRIMLALQAANNETGVIQPVAEAAQLVHAVNGALICDASQALGRIASSFSATSADVLAFSGHKFGAPQGVGALCFRPGPYHIRNTVLRGGGQERGLRAGTENAAAIMGFAAAAKDAASEAEALRAKLASFRDALERKVVEIAPEVVVFGANAPRLPNTSNFAVLGTEAQVMLMALDIEGVAVSTGSACSSGKVRRSHVLAAMGVPDSLAQAAIRVSFGWNSVEEDLTFFERAFAKAVGTMKARQVRAA